MSDFVKFQSIQQDWMAAAFAYPDFQTRSLAVTEKLDGANIQLYFDRDRPWQVGKRSGFIKRDQGFFNLWDVLDAHQDAINRVAEFAARQRLRLRLFGELFGEAVLRRIDYRTPGAIRFYGMDRDGVRLPFHDFTAFLEERQLSALRIPLLGMETIDQALRRSPVFPSTFNPDSEAEGFVISGCDQLFVSRTGMPFLCKVKNPRFADLEGSDEPIVNPHYVPIVRYINKNRIASVVSKHGAFDERKKISHYIQLVIDEINEDFLRDQGVPSKQPAENFKSQIAVLIVEDMKRNGHY